MGFQVIVFYSFAAWLIFAALMVISSKHSVKAALFLVLSFVSASAIWMLLEAEFLAISLIVVYVGAVMVLLLFVVMMLDVDYAALRQGFVKKLPVALVISIAFFAILYSFITHGDFSAADYPVAIIAAIALTFRGRRNRKVQNINKQLQANKKNRLKVVKMEPVIKAPVTEEPVEQEAKQ